MSATPTPAPERTLSEKQRRILRHLQSEAGSRTYFKSRLIADELDMTPKEVGTNMVAIREGDYGVDVDDWGYSSSTTWEVTVTE